jgi:hypothetical protein
MKPIQLTPQQRKDIDRRRKATHDRRLYDSSFTDSDGRTMSVR